MLLLAIGVSLIMNGIMLFSGDLPWRGTIVPSWMAWPYIILGVISCILGGWGLHRNKGRPTRHIYTDEEITGAESEMDAMYRREYGEMPEKPEKTDESDWRAEAGSGVAGDGFRDRSGQALNAPHPEAKALPINPCDAMSENTKFYLTFIEISMFVFLCVILDFIIIMFNITFLISMVSLPLYCINNYIAIHLFIMLFRCIKIHNILKNCDYSYLIYIMNKKNAYCDRDGYFLHPEISHAKIFLKKHLVYYIWMRSPNCQKALNLFAIGGVLFCLKFLGSASDFWIFLACGLFCWGLVKFFQGTVEVV